MLKKLVFPVIIIVCVTAILYTQYMQTDGYYFFLNMENKRELPKAFRKIPELQASGSAQFSEKSLKLMIETIPSDNIRVIDLREESHGFLNGMAVSWYAVRNLGNLGKSTEEIELDEKRRLNILLKSESVTVFTRAFIPFTVDVDNVETEKELTEKYGIKYRRLPITDHRKPTDNHIDAFIQMIKELPDDVWLHFHCLAGKGRTTSFLSMLDMMRNADRFTLEQIAKRQKDFGGLDILKAPSQTEWKYPYIVERIEFLKKFYIYCQEVPHFDIPWSEWASAHKVTQGTEK